ncbi:MAG: O-antigen ligase family protein [Clostridium sp.]|uniref:O-antigen ligase family protein n=1 Tax=Clostridium sp. TaxID=1506 RepID=UPI002909EA8A|nr:O-antigen ligase family protein [Clostridium sp.]MDU5111649.1 O-antigen ligase family protein [Clostridium sp.]
MLGILFCTNLIVMFSRETNTYSFTDFITAFSTLSIGFLIFYIKWNENDVIKGLKVLSYLSVINVAIGILMKGYLLSSDLRIVSGGILPHLVFYSSIGMYASAVLFEKFGKKKYRKLIIINLIITFLSQMRGGTIFALILFIQIIIPYIKKLKKKTVVYAVVLSPIVIFISYLMFGKMISRTLNIGADYGVGFLNTSSRFYVWGEMLKLSRGNRIFGLGIGYIKTLDEFFTDLGFISPHNEYIKFFVESGFIGLGVLLICFTIIFFIVYKNNCFVKSRKGMIRALIIGFVFFSFTDNTISAIEFWAPFTLCLSFLYEKTNITT